MIDMLHINYKNTQYKNTGYHYLFNQGDSLLPYSPKHFKIMKKLLSLLLIASFLIVFDSCQKADVLIEEDLITQEQLETRKKLREAALVVTNMTKNKNLNKLVFNEVNQKRNGLYRVGFLDLFSSEQTKSVSKVRNEQLNFLSEFENSAIKLYDKDNLKSGDVEIDPNSSVEELITFLKDNNINMYWPYSQNWDGNEIPTITYQPFDNDEENEGFIFRSSELKSASTDIYEKVLVDDDYAWNKPTIIIDVDGNVTGLEPGSGSGGNSSASTTSVNDGNFDVNKIFICRVKTNGKNFRGLFGGENYITFYRAGEELTNNDRPVVGQTFKIDRWAGRKGRYRTINQVWDYNWKPGELEQWIGVKLHRVEADVKTKFSGDINLSLTKERSVATKKDYIEAKQGTKTGLTTKLFAWEVEISRKDMMGKDAIFERKQFFNENWRDADRHGTEGGICVRLAGSPSGRGGIYFTLDVDSYNY